MLSALVWLTAGCSRQPAAPTTAPADASAVLESMNAGGENKLLPRIGGVAGYVGSSACRECHQKQYTTWHQSYHRSMTQLPVPGAVQADFNHVVLTNAGVRFFLNREGDTFWVHLESERLGTPEHPVPEPEDVPLGLVTGSHHMQVFWVPNGMGNCQNGFPFTWLIPERRWVPRNSTFLRPPTVELRPETWNFVCARCHATATQPGLDRAARTWRTQVENLGIACEACHGPGERHAAQQQALRRLGLKSSSGETNLLIVHPEKISPARASQICGFCHSMKWWDDKEGWPERGFRFRPGDDLEATTPIMRPTQLQRQPWLKPALEKNPDLFRDFFWSDGMIRVSGRDYNGLIESPCYRGGQFSCLSCHSLHGGEPDGQLARNRTDNRACAQCHERFRTNAAVVAHTHHPAESSGSQCYNCHMPHTTYVVLKAIRSHQVSSPKIADQLATGRPNACNLCHLDKTLAWTAGQLSQWYRQPMPKLSDAETAVADSVRLALSGDAGQRALEAWHFGWAPALQASVPSWVPPVLAQLLDDPYPAVRCVAVRSLQQVAPGLLPAGYDFAVPPNSRPPVADMVFEQWRKTTALPHDQGLPRPTLVRWEDPNATRAGFRRLADQRDDRPVRLRE
jgi:predicted CXXCH cytochrome family protein